jgi:hypothetical protein
MVSEIDGNANGIPEVEEGFMGIDYVNTTNLVDFEDRLKKCQYIKDLLVMSPSIPNGFDLNCCAVEVDDFSTIIC